MNRVVRLCVIVLLLLGAVATYFARARRESLRLTRDQGAAVGERLAAFPLEITDPPFRGTREVLEDRIVELSGADHYATIDYHAEGGGFVRLHVGAAVHSDAWLHEPTVCLPAHGWTTSQTVLVPLWQGLPGARPDDRVWRMTLERPGGRLLVYYWFLYGDRVVTSRGQRRWLRFQDVLAGIRDRPLEIVILYAPLGGRAEDAEGRIAGLVRALWPHLLDVLAPGD